MVKGSTLAVAAAAIFFTAAAAGFALSRAFRISFPSTVVPGQSVSWTVSGMGAGDTYDFAVPWSAEDETGTATVSGSAAGTLLVPSTLATGAYQGVFTDENTGKFLLVNFTVT